MSPFLQEKMFPVSLESLRDMREYVEKTAEGLPLSPKKVYQLKLAVDEIATNIVYYSGLNDENDRIFIEEDIQDQSLRIRLKDKGVPFDPRDKLHIEKEDLTKPAECRKIGGLGIYLAVTGVDDFHYEYSDGFNVNQFEIRFHETG